MAEQDTELTSSHEHIKNMSTCGAILTETKDWKKDSPTTKSVKKDPYRVRQEGRTNYQVRTHACRRGHRRGEGYHKFGDPPWDVSGSNHILGTQALIPGRQVPLAGLKTSGAQRKAVRNLDSTSDEHTHACLLPAKKYRKQIETAWGSGQFPGTSQHAPWPLPNTHHSPNSRTDPH